MPAAVADVVVAAAAAVAKVFCIGLVGFFAVQYPKASPLLPPDAVSTLARFSFNVLVIPLIFSSIASSVSIQSLGDYWFLLLGAFGVLSISFIVATLLSYVIPIESRQKFLALRISITFPNIVALPILIFPSLCEYSVVYEAFGDGSDKGELQSQCMAKSNTMIFSYSLVWTMLFYSIGYPSLMEAANMETSQASDDNHDHGDHSSDVTSPSTVHEASHPEVHRNEGEDRNHIVLQYLYDVIKRTLSSPPFVTTLIAFAVGCISPLRNLLFSQGGQLHFLGTASETLGQAASSILTMVVAASLVPGKHEDVNDYDLAEPGNQVMEEASGNPPEVESPNINQQNNGDPEEERSETSPNVPHKHRRRQLQKLGKSLRRSSLHALEKVKSTPGERRLLLWFTLSRLVLSPLFVILIIAGLDCRGILDTVPNLSKLVLIVNSAVPGALIVAVILKSNPELYETAAVVTKVYLPTYVLSIATIAGWTSLGLLVAIPSEEGNPFCSRS